MRQTLYRVVDSIEKMEKILKYISETSKVFCFDFETTGLSFKNDFPTILSFTDRPGFSYIVRLYTFNDFDELDMEEMGILFNKYIFSNSDILKIGYNLKFDLHFMLEYFNIELKGIYQDVGLMSHAIDDTNPKKLKELIQIYFPGLEGDYGTFKSKGEELLQYAAMDADFTMRLFIYFERQLLNDEESYRELRNIQNPGVITFTLIERKGIKLSYEKLTTYTEKAQILKDKLLETLLSFPEVRSYVLDNRKALFEKEKAIIQGKIESSKNKTHWHNKLALLEVNGIDYEINFNSPKQLADLLYFSKLGYNLYPQTDTFTNEFIYSTGAEILMAYDIPFVNVLLDYRTVTKMLGTYYEGITNLLDTNNMIHPSFMLNGTATGRLSCNNPNMQNIPVRSKSGNPEVVEVLKNIKDCFIPLDARYDTILQTDFSQAELRIIAILADDETMIEVFRNNKDIHTLTAAMISRMDLETFLQQDEKFRKKQRNTAKSANFSLVYDTSFNTYKDFIYENTKEKISEAIYKEHRGAIFNTYTNLIYWHKLYRMEGKNKGFVRTMFGKKRMLYDIKSYNQSKRSAAERIAINSPVQGTIGEWTIIVANSIRLLGLDYYTLLFNNIHDANYYYVYSNHSKFILNLINDVSIHIPLEYWNLQDDLPITLKMDFAISNESWAKVKEIEL